MAITQHWLMYALGGGWGHVTRALALARAASRLQVQTTLCVNSDLVTGYMPQAPASTCSFPAGTLLADQRGLEFPNVTFHVCDPQDEGPMVAVRVRELLSHTPFDRVIVDTFPRGLGGELAEILAEVRIPKVLVHRDLNPEYVVSHQLNDFVSRHYDLMLVPGEPPTLQPNIPVLQTPRWLIADADEIRSREAARRYWLGQHHEHDDAPSTVPDERSIVVVVATGRATEIQAMQQLAHALRLAVGDEFVVRCARLPGTKQDPTDPLVVPVWPLLPLLSGVDLVVGAGGYNTVAETTALHVPLLGFARSRLYDRQAQRLNDTFSGRSLDDIVAQIRRTLDQRTARPEVTFENGVHRAASRIAAITL